MNKHSLAEEDIPPEILRFEDKKKRKIDNKKPLEFSDLFPSTSFQQQNFNNMLPQINPFEQLFQQTKGKNSDELHFVPIAEYSNNDEDNSKEEEEPPIEIDEIGPLENEQEYILELEKWLAFKGTFEVMQSLARLRFKFMSYLLNVLKDPYREITLEDEVDILFIYADYLIYRLIDFFFLSFLRGYSFFVRILFYKRSSF